ncbi:hypothetical protein LX16_1769 [Stackebrandtia albiflava]|uniref:Uncharacterized protein n=2 Tax=Stackebrandtia albiflava TaxID=406432 RepID=A0A562VDW0_9ACTN|nr:hypothetical protein LX16_1769 [Stackebrandtia albiflava]
MIHTATARRVVGDWAGACAAARIDVDLDLRTARHRYGTELVTRLRTDLRRLAPDLLRWHMPRIVGDGRLRPGLTVRLARYHLPGVTPPALVVRTPPAWADTGQRMSLALWDGSLKDAPRHHPHPHPHRRFRLDLHRHLWDATRSGDLARRGGGIAPAGGDPSDPDPERDMPWAVSRWAAEAEILLRADSCTERLFTVRLGVQDHGVYEIVAPDDGHVPTLRVARGSSTHLDVAALPLLPEAAARVPPDLELLRRGLITVERLHPLVAEALTPGGSATPPPAAEPDGPQRVECRGQSHRIALRDGVLAAIDHHPEQLRREELLMALGGPGLPCLRAIDTVHRNPEDLPAIRERLRHGDFTGAFAVLERLLGPAATLRPGPLRDELEAAVAGRVAHGLFRSGLAEPLQRSGIDDPRSGTERGRPGGDHRPRITRRTPPAVRRKRDSRGRSRTAQSR